MLKAICGVQLKDRKRSTDLMFMLGLNETIDQLSMANSVRWYGHVLRRMDGHVLRMALDFEDGCQRKKGKYAEDTEETDWGRKYEGCSEHVRYILLIEVDCWC